MTGRVTVAGFDIDQDTYRTLLPVMEERGISLSLLAARLLRSLAANVEHGRVMVVTSKVLQPTEDAKTRSRHRLTVDDEREIVAAYLQGATAAAVAKRFNVGPARVSGLIIAAGHTPRRKIPHELTGAEREHLIGEYQAGASSLTLAAKYYLPPNRVLSTVRAAGVPIRGRGGSQAKRTGR